MGVTGRSSIEVTHVVGLLLAGAVLGGSVVIDGSFVFDDRLQRLFGVFLATVILWVTRPIPYSIASILCVILLFALGVTETFEAAVSGFASSLVFFLILLLLIGKSIAIVDLDEWIANRLVSTSSTPRGSLRRLTATILLLAFIMPSGTARTVTFMPVIDRINDLYGLGPGSAFRRAAYYVIGHVNHIGSTALMTGGGLAIVTAALINALVQPMTWLEWALYMIPPASGLFLVASMTGIVVYRVPSDLSIPEGSASDRATLSADPEPLARNQIMVLATLGLAVVLWVVGSFLGIDAIIPAMIVVTILALPGVRVLTTEEVRDISWGIVFLIGAMLSVLEVMDDLDAIDLIVSALVASVPRGANPLGILIVLFGVAVLIRAIFSSVAAAIVILLPIVLEFATVLGVNTLYTSFSLMLVLVSTSLLPFNVSTVLLAFERGPLTVREVFGLGLLTVALSCGIVSISWLVYWPTVDTLVASTFG